MGYRGASSIPPGSLPVWVRTFDHYAEYPLGQYGGYTEFEHDVVFPAALTGNEIIEIDMVTNGDAAGDLLDMWFRDLSGSDLFWPYYSSYEPYYSQTILRRSPEQSNSTDYLASTTEGWSLSNFAGTPYYAASIDSGRGLIGLTGIRLVIGLQPLNYTGWARMRGTVRLYSQN